MEYLIRPIEGEWFNLHKRDFGKALRPNSYATQEVKGWGDHRISVLDAEIAFSYEDPGIQVSFTSNTIEDAVAAQIVNEIAQNITMVTGQASRIIELG